MEKITDNEIIKALECCGRVKDNNCDNCPLTELQLSECTAKAATEALDLINRQKAEIERLRKHLDLAEQCISEVEDAAYRGGSNDYIDSAIDRYNNLVKEMTEEDKNG